MIGWWKQWIKRYLLRDADKDAARETLLCDTLEHELDLLDRTINMQGKSALKPSEFNQNLSMLTPSAYLPWATVVNWPRRDVETVQRTGFSIYSTPHRTMWLKFQMDFPIEHAPYRLLQLHGLFRTKVEIRVIDIGSGEEALEAVYYTFVPIESLRDEDRGNVSTDDRSVYTEAPPQ